MKPKHTQLTEDCRPVSEILALVGDKWSVLVVRMLGDGPRRFNELRRTIGGISQRMLTLTLRGLERDGLVTRTAFATIPPRVDYALTRLGRSLLTPVTALARWAQRNQPAMDAARARFDAARGVGSGGSQRSAPARPRVPVEGRPKTVQHRANRRASPAGAEQARPLRSLRHRSL